jgi:predicted molibdopterin-dependent oxidoreductase YjgC
MIVKNMKNEKNIELLKQLAKDIANNRNKWIIIKEINDMIDTHYDKYHFTGILAKYNVLKPEYFEVLEKLEDKELLSTLKKYIRETIFNKS